MKRIVTSIVLALLSLVVLTRAAQNNENLRRRLVSNPFSLDSSRVEHREGLSDFLFAELGEEEEKLWTDLIMTSSESMSMSMRTPPHKYTL
jgi:hypothetical protein